MTRFITPTRVVNIKKDQYDVYIGRSGHGLDGYFGNPFKLGSNDKRGDTLDKYRTYFYDRLANDEEFYNRIIELKGSVLGCFCKPNACHGDIICEYLNNL